MFIYVGFVCYVLPSTMLCTLVLGARVHKEGLRAWLARSDFDNALCTDD